MFCILGAGAVWEPTRAEAGQAQPPTSARQTFNIPRAPLHAALQSLARQSGINFVVRDIDLAAWKPRAIYGSSSIDDTLERLLEGQAQFRYLDAKTILITPVGATFMEPSDCGRACIEESGAAPIRYDEIIVTAGKRAETFLTAPASVSIVSGSELEISGVQEFARLAGRFSNLAVGVSGDGLIDARTLGVRGVSGPDAVSLFIDEAPAPPNLSPYIFDLEQVEFVRGSQGALYGANALAGVIKIHTAEPELFPQMRTRGEVSATREGGVSARGEAVFNLPLGERDSALRISSYAIRESGVYDNISSLPGPEILRENVDDRMTYGARLKAQLSLTDNFKISTSVWAQRADYDGYSLADHAPGQFLRQRLFDLDEPGSERWVNASISATLDHAPWRLTSISSYFYRRVEESEDSSEFLLSYFDLDNPIPARMADSNKSNSFTQEFRFSAFEERPLSYSFDLFFRQDTVNDQLLPLTVPAGASPSIDRDILVVAFDSSLRTREAAIYAESVWRPISGLSIRPGIRIHHTTLKTERWQSGLLFGDIEQTIERRRGNTDVAPTFKAIYEVNENTSVYGSIVNGYRFGGFNFPVPQDTCAPSLAALGLNAESALEYDTDKTWTQEIGIKTHDRRSGVRASLALYKMNWRDIQQRVFLPCGFPITINTAGTHNTGIDFDSAIPLSDSVTLNTAVGYLRVKGRDESMGSVAPLENAPRWTAFAGVTFQRPISAMATVGGALEARYVGKSYSNVSNPDDLRIRDAYWLVDANLGVELRDWRIALRADNILNNIANLSDARPIGVELPGRIRYVTTWPRTIGVSVERSF